ncbi:MAG TPA: MFS transporter [Jatrophihabitans sp.]|uniref:MFS transporter n=1 Tax=Jatrophihabitans sp. TaxID=1932789 RepID=UPI002E0B8BEC|nr:MFS transporter [Jatrophihabitans sp.]
MLTESPPGPSTRRRPYRATYAVLAVGTSAYSLLQSLVSPVLPLLETELHTDQATVTWVLTAYLLSASVFTPIIGRVGDMIGKGRMLVVALGVLAVGSVLAALASSIGVMIVARAIQGVGGGVIPLAFGIIRDEFPRPKVPAAVGTVAALLAVGGGAGLVLAGPIVNTLDYHWLFWIPAIMVGAAAVATHFVVPPSPVRTAGRVNWLAAILLSSWLVALLLAISEAPRWGWTSVTVIGLIVASVVLAAAWIRVELRAREPLIDMRMMRAPAVWSTNLVAFLFGAGLYTVFAFLPEFIQTPRSAGYGFGASVTESGFIVLPMAVAMFVFGQLAAPLSSRFGSRSVLIAGSAVSVLPFLMLALAHDRIWEVSVATGLLGVGFGLAFSAMSNIIVDVVPSHQTGVASGMNANIRTIGGSIGAAVVASVVTAQLQASGLPTESGYVTSYLVLAAVLVLAALAGLLIPTTTPERDAHQIEQGSLRHPAMAIVAAGTLVGDDPE